MLQSAFGSSSFADLLSAPYTEDPAGGLPEELDPFPDVFGAQSQTGLEQDQQTHVHGDDSCAPLPSFQVSPWASRH